MRYEIQAVDNLLLFNTRDTITLIQGENRADSLRITLALSRDILPLQNMVFTLKGTIGSVEIREVLLKDITEDSIQLDWNPSEEWTANYGTLKLTLIATESVDDDIVVAKWIASDGILVQKDPTGSTNQTVPDVGEQLYEQMSEAVAAILPSSGVRGDLLAVGYNNTIVDSGYCYADLKQPSFSSYIDAVDYARTSTIAYIGQSLVVMDEENDQVTVYVIANSQGDLSQVGQSNTIINYNELSEKPSINGVPLVGDKTSSDLEMDVVPLTNLEIEALLV